LVGVDQKSSGEGKGGKKKKQVFATCIFRVFMFMLRKEEGGNAPKVVRIHYAGRQGL